MKNWIKRIFNGGDDRIKELEARVEALEVQYQYMYDLIVEETGGPDGDSEIPLMPHST